MRKAALFSSLIVAFTTIQIATAQNIYIRYDAECVEKLEYRFVEQESGVAYNAYKVTKNANENVYFETGVEVPQVRKSAPSKMVGCNAVNLDKADIADINSGKRKAFIVKKLDSGWAYLPVGSASYMSFHDNIITYLDATSDFKADLRTAMSDNDLNLDKSEEQPKAAVYYIGEMTACNFTAYQFKKSPRVTCKEDAVIAILPGLGLIQDFATGGQRFELVAINNTDVCGYYATPTAPEPVLAEPQPNVPQNYNVIVQGQPQPEIQQAEYVMSEPVQQTEYVAPTSTEYVAPTSTVVEHDVTKSDNFGESTHGVAPQSYAAIASKSTDAEPEPACENIAQEGEHIVQAGESLYGIARRYGLSMSSLRDWNGITDDKIYPCSPLKVTAPVVAASMEEKRQNDVPQSYNTVAMPKPKPVKEATKVAAVDCHVEATEGEHVVLKGESLYAIARTYNLTVADLRAWNSLTDDKIMLCQKLVVVAPEVESKAIPTEYATIPKQYSTIPKQIEPAAAKRLAHPKGAIKTNSKETIAVKMPAPKAVKAAAKPKAVEPYTAKAVTITAKSVPVKQTVTFVKKGAGLHVVQKGETVSRLAKETGMTEGEFRTLNNLGKGEKILIGQVLRMQNCACNVTVDADNSLILKPVPIASDIVGDVPSDYSYVPKSKKSVNTEGAQLTAKSVDNRETRTFHVVQTGETLYSIAKTYKKKVEDIRELSHLEANEVIVPGQLLILE